MKHLNLVTVASSIVFLAFGALYSIPISVAAQTAALAPFNRSFAKNAERYYLCNQNQNGVKESMLNPTCKGWTGGFVDSDKPILLALKSGACQETAAGNLTCYFKTGKAACEGYAKTIENDGLNFSKFCGCGYQVNSTTFSCGYCTESDGCATNGKFISAPNLKCPNNADVTGPTLFSLTDPIPASDSPKYCSTEVNGPYSNLATVGEPETFAACGQTYPEPSPGMVFVADQRFDMIDLNKANNSNNVKSDLAGFCYDPPQGNANNCIEKDPTGMYCKEPLYLSPNSNTWATRPNVHHVVPKKDQRGCPCGKNSVKNAAVISAQMNSVFSNKDLTTITNKCAPMGTEQEVLESMGKYNAMNEIIYRMNRAPKFDVSLLSKLPAVKNKITVNKSQKQRLRKKPRR